MKKENILLTGKSGFLGQRTYEVLLSKGYHIYSLGRDKTADIYFDLSKSDNVTLDKEIDFVIHCAGKAHIIPKTTEEELAFDTINYTGTKQICKNLELVADKIKCFVFISTVAVYGLENGKEIDENAELKGSSPYAKSKIKAEQFLSDWCTSRNIKFVILRLPLVFGWTAPGNLGDLIKNVKRGIAIRITGNNAKKSILHVDDIALNFEKIIQHQGIFNITDGYHPTYNELLELLARKYNKKILSINIRWITLLARIGDLLGKRSPLNSSKIEKLTSPLTFSDKKARKELAWESTDIINF